MSCKASDEIAASVATKASIVAMFGAIMPEPLAIPAIRTVWPSIVASATAPLGKVSVVMMASEASAQPSGDRRAAISGNTASIFAASSSTPITPVEASMTSSGAADRACAAAAAVRRAASAPGGPVKLLAQPALHTSARTAPPFCWIADWHQSTGAEPTPCRVNTPAAIAPSSNAINSTSGRSCL